MKLGKVITLISDCIFIIGGTVLIFYGRQVADIKFPMAGCLLIFLGGFALGIDLKSLKTVRGNENDHQQKPQ